MSEWDQGFYWGVAITMLLIGGAVGFYQWARYRR